jgi:hypothetical protein
MKTRFATLAVLLYGLAGCSGNDGSGTDTAVDTGWDTLDTTETVDGPDGMDAPDTEEATDPPPDDGVEDTIGRPCARDEDCQNGLFCDGEERCPYGFCTRGSLPDCSDGVNCTIDTCNEETDGCDHEVDDAACDDSNPCTDDSCTVETDTCVNAPIDCSDDVNCTLDTCDTSTGACEHTVTDLACDDSDACTIDTCDVETDTCANTLIDGDGDLHPPESCGGDDCDDTEPTIYTGATEVCADGIDQDCDGADAPEGECDCPVPVTVPSTTTGDNTGMPNVYTGSCSYGTGGLEVVHRLDLSAATDVRIMVSDSWFSGTFYVREGSCSGTELDCMDFWSGSIDLSLAAGSYFIFVDGDYTYDVGPYELDIRAWVPPTPVTGNVDCGSAYVLTADGSFGGTNVGAGNDLDPTSCAYSDSGEDVWFTFTLTASSSLSFETYGSDYDTVLYILGGGCTGSEIECDDDGGVSLDSYIRTTLGAGTYYLVLDAYSTYDSGDWTLTVTGLP